MAVIEDIKNELYNIDNSQWSANLTNILALLSFPVHLEYLCNRDEFLYEYSGKSSIISTKERNTLYNCYEIAEYKMERKLNKIQMFAVYISGNLESRNEKVYEIYKVFVKLYGRLTMLAVVCNNEMSFVGINMNPQNHSEVIISEWFGYYDDKKLEKLSEIDFSLFCGKSVVDLYNEYIWAISREYIRYPESRMYLIYGLDNLITYEKYVETPDSDKPILTTRVDREETLTMNSMYYQNIYDGDYFSDDRNIEIEEEFIMDEDETEFEWTMLELELAAEEIEEDDEEVYFETDEDKEDNDHFEELVGLTPEEMLEYIHNR